MKGNFHVRFLGGKEGVSPLPTRPTQTIQPVFKNSRFLFKSKNALKQKFCLNAFLVFTEITLFNEKSYKSEDVRNSILRLWKGLRAVMQ